MQVLIQYFKHSGKWYTDEYTEWPQDREHFDGWKPMSDVVRIKDMIAVCVDAPQGFPQMFNPFR